MLTAYCPRDIPTTPQGDLRRLRESISRQHLLRSHAALWCPDCQATQAVTDSFGTIVQLACKHRRELTPGLGVKIARLEQQVAAQQGVPE